MSQPNNLRLVLAQLNFTVGDIEGNVERIAIARQARDELNADLIIFPELAVSGYPPEDLLLRPDFYAHVARGIEKIKTAQPEIFLIVGYPEKGEEDKNFNALKVFFGGKEIANYRKQDLPNYGVFDEKRYFTPGEAKSCVIDVKGFKLGINICEDLWFPEPAAQCKASGAQIIISINASPFDVEKPFLREEIVIARAKENHLPIVYLNTVGAQDELVFDGGSMVSNREGDIVARAPFFAEKLQVVDFDENANLKNEAVLQIMSEEERVYEALVLGARDYINKNKFKGAVIGLSGGIDSALTLAVAVDAIGAESVETLYMPSRYSRKISGIDAEKVAKNFRVKHSVIDIGSILKAYLKSLKKIFRGLKPDVTEENLQARIRGALLMAVSNKKGLLVLSTGNKSEMATGYSTLYGDMVGGFAILKDVPKTLVYRLVAWRNKKANADIIPERIITRPPSAELRDDQLDTDTLPPYPILDEILERYIEKDESRDEIVAAGFDAVTVNKVVSMVNRNEYKRRQAPVGVRITTRAFGRDRRYPITNAFHL